MPRIDTASARSLLAANPDVLVVDVRTPAEYDSAHIDGAINLPLDQVDAHLRRIVTDGLNPRRLALAKPDAIVMHPGPINRGVEIDPVVADGPRAVILDQVSRGVAVRMAILYLLAGGEILE